MDSFPVKIVRSIVIIDMENAQGYGLEKAETYAGLIEHLIQSGAKGVLLTLPSSIANTPFIPSTDSREKDPIKELVAKQTGRIVFTANAYKVPEKTVLPTYNKYLNLTNNDLNAIANPEINPLKNFQGFFEFFPDFDLDSNNNNLNPVRYPYLSTREFYLADQVDKKKVKFLSSTCLAFLNFQPSPQQSNICNESSKRNNSQNKIVQVRFLDPKNGFKTIKINNLCKQDKSGIDFSSNCRNSVNAETDKEISGKIVLIGAPERDPLSFTLSSPFENSGKTPSIEMQANLLASIIDNSFYAVLGYWRSFGVILSGAALVVILFTLIAAYTHKWLLIYGSTIIIGVPVIYGVIVTLAAYLNLILPIVLPISAWVLIGNSTIISLLLWRYQEQASQQKQKLVERTAILSETQKLLSRVATDIHDRPLQDLKLVMDRLEELAYDQLIDPGLLYTKHSRTDSIALVDKLANIGQDIRNHLNDIQTIAQKKWTISPELTPGLAAGIEHRLDFLVSDGKLRLNVTKNISPLKEPTLDIAWINAREDIFRFFKEAINNIMKHAQPFNGDATEVTILLKKEDNQCTLIVRNDGSQTTQPNPNGTGTKIMETIAAGLPNGTWQREWFPEGGVSVSLRWTMPSD